MKNFIRFLTLTALSYLLLPAQLAAQSAGPFTITTTSTGCTALPNVAEISTDDTKSTVAIYVSGTWTGTLQPEGTIQGQTAFNVLTTPAASFTPQATITANGGYGSEVAGYSTFKLCGPTSTGTAKVWLNVSPALSIAASGAVASGVTSFSGDGTLISNSGSTGAVTATLANAAANTVFGNNTGSSAAPNYYSSSTFTSGGLILSSAGATAPASVTADDCGAAVHRSMWLQMSDGNYAVLGGTDTTSNVGPAIKGVLDFCRRISYNDTTANNVSNAALAIQHNAGSGGTLATAGQDDRALLLGIANGNASFQAFHSLFASYAETNLSATPTFGAHANGEVSASVYRGTMGDSRTNAVAGPLAVFSALYTRNNANTDYTGCTITTSSCPIGFYSFMQSVLAPTTLTAGTTFSAFFAEPNNANNNTTGLYVGFHSNVFVAGRRFAEANYAFRAEDFGTSALDYDLDLQGVNTAGTASGFSRAVGPFSFGTGTQAATGYQVDVLGAMKLKAGAAVDNLCFFGSTSGQACIRATAAQGTPNSILLPTVTGAAGAVLISDGANPQQTSWSTGGLISGLTANTIPKATSATALGNSSVTDDGTTVATVEAFSQGTAAAFALNSAGLLTKYNGITTAGLGIPAQTARVRAVSQTAAIGTTTLLATGAANTDYLVVATLYCDTTSAAATVSISITYTDPGSASQSIAPSAAACTALGSGSFALINSPIVAKASTNIQYATSIVNTPTYDVRIDLYQLGTN